MNSPNALSPHVFSPASIPQLLSMKRDMPNALVYAGGSYILRKSTEERFDLPSDIIFLGRMEELKKVTRTERYLEIGSMVPMNRVIRIGKHILPECLYSALHDIGSPAVRNLATMGGNLCVKERRMTTFPVLLLLDTRLELRKSGSIRWVQLNQFMNGDGTLDFRPGEVLTRLRIPFPRWNFQEYRSLKSGIVFSRNDVNMCALGQLQKGILSDFRFAFGSIGPFLYRNRELESQIIGKKIPFSDRDLDGIRSIMQQSLAKLGSEIPTFQKDRIVNLLLGTVSLIQTSALNENILLPETPHI